MQVRYWEKRQTKHMKKYLIASSLVIGLLLPSLSFAAFNDVTLTPDATVITIGGLNVSVYASNSTTESIIESTAVSANSFDVVLLSGSSITLVSTDRRVFALSPPSGTFTKTTTCDQARSVLTLTGTGASVTITIDLDSSQCAMTSSGSGGGGGGGGGGSGSSSTPPPPPPTVPPPVVPPSVTPPVDCPVGALFNSATGLSCTSFTPVPTTLPTFIFSFSRVLTIGLEGDDVIALQNFLESNGFLVIPPGTAKGYFGSLTRNALKNFQSANGIDPVGIFGPKTRASVEAKLGKKPAPSNTVSPITPLAKILFVFEKNMSVGTSHPDIRELQRILNRAPDTRIGDEGVGSPGNETEYFGTMTEGAVQRFQEKYKIVGSEDPGYGAVGPKTRAKLNELLK